MADNQVLMKIIKEPINENKEASLMDKNKMISMILNGAIGDQYGAPLEMLHWEYIANYYKDLSNYIITCKNEEPGKLYTYTDDTQMTISVMNILISVQSNLKNITKELVVSKYLENFEPYRGYCRQIYQLFFDMLIDGKNETTLNMIDNGGIMRISPLAISCFNESFEVIKDIVAIIHHPTHNNEIANEVSSLFVWTLIQFNKLKREEINLIKITKIYEQLLDMAETDIVQKKLNCILNNITNADPNVEFKIVDELNGLDAVECYESFSIALWCIIKNINTNNLSNILQQAIRYGGDTDTVAGLVGQLSGALFGDESINKDWLSKLENAEIIKSQINTLLSMV